MWNPNTYDCECNNASKIDKSYEKNNFFVLTILNTTETSLVDEKVTCKKNNCLIYTITLVNTYLFLLAVISISCCYHLQSIGCKTNMRFYINFK